MKKTNNKKGKLTSKVSNNKFKEETKKEKNPVTPLRRYPLRVLLTTVNAFFDTTCQHSAEDLTYDTQIVQCTAQVSCPWMKVILNCRNTDEIKMWSSQLQLKFKQLQILARKRFQGFRGIRTFGLWVCAAVLYQLSYRPTYWKQTKLKAHLNPWQEWNIEWKWYWTAARQMKWRCDHSSRPSLQTGSPNGLFRDSLSNS